MRAARHYLIHGRVQGVGFRYFTRKAAMQTGVAGWVRNLPGGSVEIEAEADDSALLDFERALREGPAGSRVDSLETMERQPGIHASTFEIR